MTISPLQPLLSVYIGLDQCLHWVPQTLSLFTQLSAHAFSVRHLHESFIHPPRSPRKLVPLQKLLQPPSPAGWSRPRHVCPFATHGDWAVQALLSECRGTKGVTNAHVRLFRKMCAAFSAAICSSLDVTSLSHGLLNTFSPTSRQRLDLYTLHRIMLFCLVEHLTRLCKRSTEDCEPAFITAALPHTLLFLSPWHSFNVPFTHGHSE